MKIRSNLNSATWPVLVLLLLLAIFGLVSVAKEESHPEYTVDNPYVPAWSVAIMIIVMLTIVIWVSITTEEEDNGTEKKTAIV